MAARPQRSSAGKNIGKLINQEVEGVRDDFYSTAYGGFGEESEDEEYASEVSEEDDVDSDFDLDETEWGPDDKAEDILQKKERERKRQKSWMPPKVTKRKVPPPDTETKPKKTKPKTTLIVTSSLDTTTEQRSFRKSTQEISKGFRKRMEEEQMMKRHRRHRQPKKLRKLTQEELLEEAKWTEIENLASLEAYTNRIEAERKKVKDKKVLWSGPVIRYLSVAMPMVSEVVKGDGGDVSSTSSGGDLSTMLQKSSTSEAPLPPTEDPVVPMETNTNDLDKSDRSALMDQTTPSASQPKPLPPLQRQSRNFLVFTDTNNFPEEYFPLSNKPARPRRKYCPVTGLPAKYIDPLTRTPYATPFAFKIIRMKYVSEAEQKCEERLVQLSNWLEEKKKKKKETI